MTSDIAGVAISDVERAGMAQIRMRLLTSIGSTPEPSAVEGIAAGTSEIQRGIIAQRGLGLSRI
jgi:hypothetical protein